MELTKKIWNTLYNFLKDNLIYIILLGAIASLVIAYTCVKNDEILFDIFKTLGFTIITGSVFAGIVKSDQFSKIFQNELRNIIYGDEDLKNRNDLDVLWEKVTKALCNQKFKNISLKLHDGVKKYYLPINHEYYYRNHNVEIDFEFDKDNPEYLIVTEEINTTIISDDLKPINFYYSSKIDLISTEPELTTYELLSFSVNKEKIDMTNHLDITADDKFLSIKCNYEVKGKNQYNIIRKEKKRYHLKANSCRHHNAIWLYENFYLDITFPKKMEIKFIEMGVMENWDIEPKENNYKNRFKASYSGLIFKKQGFILLMNKI